MRLFMIGAGGFAREVLDIVEALRDDGDDIEVVGIHADGGGDVEELRQRGYDLNGDIASLPAPARGAALIIAIGAPHVRATIAWRVESAGWSGATLVHPMASIGSRVELGPGAVVCAGARLTTNIRSGKHLQVHVNATIGHDTVLGDCVTLLPLSSVSGRVRVGSRVVVGTGANIIENRCMADDVTVGAGAVVIRDVAAGQTVVGVPAGSLGH